MSDEPDERECIILSNILRIGQGSNAQCPVSSALPSHFLPCPDGAGLSHVLPRTRTPPPQEAEQDDHACHDDHFPSTSANGKQLNNVLRKLYEVEERY